MKTRTIRKFKFSDQTLAEKVRGNMWNILIKFDVDQSSEFSQKEIKQALMEILGEDQNQLSYVVKNVFRYDLNGDGAVSYAQFTNFSVQQHFGELAIQRLHRKGYYTNGARRIMNLQEFEATLNYCLDFIHSQGSHGQYDKLFNEVDLDRDGFISYQDYFIFLREYFGSQSQAYEQEQKNPSIRKIQPIPQYQKKKSIKAEPVEPLEPVEPAKPIEVKYIDGSAGENAQERFAKLVYSQFKITIMEKDRNKNLLLERNQVQDILSNALKLNYTEQMQLQDKCISSGVNSVKYEDFMRTVVVAYMSEISSKKIYANQSLSENEFVQFVIKVCDFVSIKPAENTLRTCFRESGMQNISQSEYVSLMKDIFENFKFDTRGLSTSRVPKAQAETIQQNTQSSSYHSNNYQSLSIQPPSYQSSSYQSSKYQLPNYDSPSYLSSAYQATPNFQPAVYQPSSSFQSDSYQSSNFQSTTGYQPSSNYTPNYQSFNYQSDYQSSYLPSSGHANKYY